MKNKIWKYLFILSCIPYIYILLNTLFEKYILTPYTILVCLIYQIICIIIIIIIKIKCGYKELKQEYKKIEKELQNDINTGYKIIDTTDEIYKTIQENKKEIRDLKNKINNIESRSNLIISICLPIEIFLWTINNITNYVAIFILISMAIYYICETINKNIKQEMVYMLEDANETKVLNNNKAIAKSKKT